MAYALTPSEFKRKISLQEEQEVIKDMTLYSFIIWAKFKSFVVHVKLWFSDEKLSKRLQ